MTLLLGFSRERVSAPLQRSRQGSEALQYSAGDVEIHRFVQVFNQIITILSIKWLVRYLTSSLNM
jgi:hypothetical protein